MGHPGTFALEGTPEQPLYSPKLHSALQRLDALFNWEQSVKASSGPDALRFARRNSQPAQRLLSRLSNPQHDFSSVHITGSKGKGSVATLITAAMLHAPFLVSVIGTFGSPHIERVNERIRINSRPIPDDDFATALTNVMDAREADPVVQNATWFDCMTVAGLSAFRRAGAKWAVVEVGMGGRLDSTNVLSAPVSVITNLRLEHAHVIGPTLKDIAYEKAGVIAAGADVICGLEENEELAQIFVQEAKEKCPPANIQFCPPTDGGSLFEHNLKMARAAMRAVARREGVEDLTDEELLPVDVAKTALAQLPARQEMFTVLAGEGGGDECVRVLLDGAHVAESVAQVLKEAESLVKPVVLLGVGKDKNVGGICKTIHAIEPEHVFASATGPELRYLQPEALADVLRRCGDSPVSCVEDASKALKQAIALAHEKKKDLVVIGSLYFAGRIRPELRNMQQVYLRSQKVSQANML